MAKNVHQTGPEENLTLDALHLNVGKVHLLNQVIYTIATWFLQYGFQVVELDEVVSSHHCFDLLNVPINHPARSKQDTFYFDQTTLLRPHCTVTSAIFLQQYSGKEPLKLLTYGNVYRNDDDDPTHSHQFMQIDFLWLEAGISIANLKWLLQRLLNYLFRQELAVRYRLSYFPFTEPSFECDISCIICQQQGCSICKKTGWIEVLGAGMLHSEVLKLTKTDSQLSAIACGMGVERLVMLLYQIEDIRNFYLNNFNFLHSF